MLTVLKFKSAIASGILDMGEDCIFLGEDRFKQFMQSVEAITQEMPKQVISFDTMEQKEIAEVIDGQGKTAAVMPDILEDEPEEKHVKRNDIQETGAPEEDPVAASVV